MSRCQSRLGSGKTNAGQLRNTMARLHVRCFLKTSQCWIKVAGLKMKGRNRSLRDSAHTDGKGWRQLVQKKGQVYFTDYRRRIHIQRGTTRIHDKEGRKNTNIEDLLR